MQVEHTVLDGIIVLKARHDTAAQEFADFAPPPSSYGASDMKILVTGGAGFIGSAVIRHAITLGHQVVNLDAVIHLTAERHVDHSIDGSSNFLRTLQERQSLQVGSPDAIAWAQDWIDDEAVTASAKFFGKTGYGAYLNRIRRIPKGLEKCMI